MINYNKKNIFLLLIALNMASHNASTETKKNDTKVIFSQEDKDKARKEFETFNKKKQMLEDEINELTKNLQKEDNAALKEKLEFKKQELLEINKKLNDCSKIFSLTFKEKVVNAKNIVSEKVKNNKWIFLGGSFTLIALIAGICYLKNQNNDPIELENNIDEQ